MTPKQLKQLRALPVPQAGNRLADAFGLSERSRGECIEVTGFTAQYISDMVKGRFQNISIDNARKFANFFGCQIEDLFPAREAVA